MSGTNECRKLPVGEGCYVSYRPDLNGWGGFRFVDIALCKDDVTVVREMVNSDGYINDFPGWEEGDWLELVRGSKEKRITYCVEISEFKDAKALFSWMVQPDGGYWMDEDGFGMLPDAEVWLHALFDKTGRFVAQFSEELPDGYSTLIKLAIPTNDRAVIH